MLRGQDFAHTSHVASSNANARCFAAWIGFGVLSLATGGRASSAFAHSSTCAKHSGCFNDRSHKPIRISDACTPPPPHTTTIARMGTGLSVPVYAASCRKRRSPTHSEAV